MGSGGVDREVLFLDEIYPEDGLVPGQSSEDVHRSSDFPSLEVHGAVQPPHDLNVAAAGGRQPEPVVWRRFLWSPVAGERPVLFLRDTGYR